jgi:hypothetical protein
MRRQMNLYLVLAIALGAVSGTTTAPIARPLAANVVHLECGGRAAVLECRERQHGSRTPESIRRAARCLPRVARLEVPLTGAASPRAPALT